MEKEIILTLDGVKFHAHVKYTVTNGQLNIVELSVYDIVRGFKVPNHANYLIELKRREIESQVVYE